MPTTRIRVFNECFGEGMIKFNDNYRYPQNRKEWFNETLFSQSEVDEMKQFYIDTIDAFQKYRKEELEQIRKEIIIRCIKLFGDSDAFVKVNHIIVDVFAKYTHGLVEDKSQVIYPITSSDVVVADNSEPSKPNETSEDGAWIKGVWFSAEDLERLVEDKSND